MRVGDIFQNQQQRTGRLAVQPLQQRTLVRRPARARPRYNALVLWPGMLFQHLAASPLHGNSEVLCRLDHGGKARVIPVHPGVLHKQFQHRLRAMPQQGLHRVKAGIHQGFIHNDACTLDASRKHAMRSGGGIKTQERRLSGESLPSRQPIRGSSAVPAG